MEMDSLIIINQQYWLIGLFFLSVWMLLSVNPVFFYIFFPFRLVSNLFGQKEKTLQEEVQLQEETAALPARQEEDCFRTSGSRKD